MSVQGYARTHTHTFTDTDLLITSLCDALLVFGACRPSNDTGVKAWNFACIASTQSSGSNCIMRVKFVVSRVWLRQRFVGKILRQDIRNFSGRGHARQ